VASVGMWRGGVSEATAGVVGRVRLCRSGCEVVWGCVGDGGRPALGRAGAGSCSGIRGAGMWVLWFFTHLMCCRCRGGLCTWLRGGVCLWVRLWVLVLACVCGVGVGMRGVWACADVGVPRCVSVECPGVSVGSHGAVCLT
jgi:hypothetical protein